MSWNEQKASEKPSEKPNSATKKRMPPIGEGGRMLRGLPPWKK
jgi:hypothetical protein